MKVQDFSGGGIKHENCHRRTECDMIAITSPITSRLSQIGKLSLISGHPNQSYSAVSTFFLGYFDVYYAYLFRLNL